MDFLFQRNSCTSVRITKSGLQAETKHCDSKGEAVATLQLDKNTFIINEAYLETHRAITGSEIIPVPELVGIEAYLGKGAELKQAFAEIDEPMAASLFIETIKGIIQAETFLVAERGYSSTAKYGEYWKTMHVGSCRYYSNLDRAERGWDEYAGDGPRKGYQFLRSKTYFLYSIGHDEYQVSGGINDSFHEMHACLKIASGRLNSIEGKMLRVPHDICEESAGLLNDLIGIGISSISRKDISLFLGKGQGCVHLIDIVCDALDTFRYYLCHPWEGQ